MKKTILTLALTALAAVFTIRCSGSATAPTTATPTAPNVPGATTAVLASISLSASTVVGGNLVTGTVGLTAAAPADGATVSLSGTDPVTVPAAVMVLAGSTSATFLISTRGVTSDFSRTIGASYGGTSASAALAITGPAVATARFGVSGPAETQTCELINGGNTLDCTFDGSTSTAAGPIVAWDWSWSVATTLTKTTTGPVLAMPGVNCGLIPPPPFPEGTTWFPLTVTLKVHDSLGNVSAEVTDSGSRLFPQGSCGF